MTYEPPPLDFFLLRLGGQYNIDLKIYLKNIFLIKLSWHKLYFVLYCGRGEVVFSFRKKMTPQCQNLTEFFHMVEYNWKTQKKFIRNHVRHYWLILL